MENVIYESEYKIMIERKYEMVIILLCDNIIYGERII